jgi:hypothetical protein
MAYPMSPYVEERNGGLYVAGTGVSLDSVVIRFQQGADPGTILETEKAINDYVAEGEREFDRSAVPLSQTNPELFGRLEAVRRNLTSQRP